MAACEGGSRSKDGRIGRNAAENLYWSEIASQLQSHMLVTFSYGVIFKLTFSGHQTQRLPLPELHRPISSLR